MFVSGLVYGWLSWRTNGLEAVSAMHSINNLMAFYVVALGISSISSNVSYWNLAIILIIDLISAVAVYYIGDKKGWFDEETPDKLI